MTGLSMYADNQTPTADQVVTHYAPLVKRIAYHLMTRLPPSVQADDLIQAGMIGLLEASRNYDASQGASFETYAGIRIRGSMLDEIRKGDWAPRSLHRKMRQVAEAIREIEGAAGRDARDSEVAERLGLGLPEYHQILKDASGHKVFSFEDLVAGDENILGSETQPLDEIERGEFKSDLATTIAGLPERERLVMQLYYDEELNLREIGDVLSVSESRVCQIHSQALLRVKSRMSGWRDEE
ncbi:MAG: RNA polymerase sigma factor for flagellar operon FliA [Gammaproteobacteria bacterium]|jgi:RNA polymerase sigma factor for flagellar operon FliA